MRTRPLLLTAAGLAAVAVVVRLFGASVAAGAPSEPPHAYSTASPNAHSTAAPHVGASAAPRSSASAVPPEGANTRFDLPPLAKEMIPTDKSDLPTADEWKTAPAIEVTRRSPTARWCRVYRVREYVKVHCGMPLSGLRQLAGSPKDVQLFVTPKSPDKNMMDPPNGGQAIFPLRRGEARLFQFFELGSDGWEGFSPDPSVVIDASWPDGLEHPTVILR